MVLSNKPLEIEFCSPVVRAVGKLELMIIPRVVAPALVIDPTLVCLVRAGIITPSSLKSFRLANIVLVQG